jgi:hypothetical protein
LTQKKKQKAFELALVIIFSSPSQQEQSSRFLALFRANQNIILFAS